MLSNAIVAPIASTSWMGVVAAAPTIADGAFMPA
jgi:hypothetical protein